ncbi:hypothetical protein [Athalassotoga saccharophila]|uniref:hypothetical protein n=1 Tax=Athalassotoga saccharophila TaxID=1441386 RepID=UPI00137A15C5|nr:hypothetical protein [Athalassotoga saccharophila]BBJ27934.1 hypothetical protein ATHSA_0828 [Athalassotoga saccharophila]
MMKFFTVLSIVVVLASFAFAFNLQVGGGVEIASFWTSGVALPTINTSFAFPISSNLSLTGQLGSILTQQMGYITSTSTQSAALLALVGVRYTTYSSTSGDFQRFVGADVGVISNFIQSSGVSPIVGINAGYIFPIVSGFEGYVKGALRVMMVSVPTSSQIGSTFPLSLPVVEVSTGLNFSF